MKHNFLNVFREYSWKTLVIHLSIVAVVAVLAISVFFFVYLPGVTNHDQTLTVPNLEGMNYEQLEEFLGKRGLRFEVSDSAYSSIYPPLTVLKQYPEAGALVKENRKIYVTVKAREPQKVKIPDDMVGRSLKNAELILKSYGLKRGKITYKPDLAANAVLEIWHDGEKIKPGTTIAKGSAVDLIVGDGYGNREFSIGNFVGKELEDVEFALSGQGLNVGAIILQVVDDEYLPSEYVADSLGAPGVVIRQNPPAGTTVRLGNIVDLWIGFANSQDSLEFVNQRNDIIDEE